jgi:replicative DNA helicase
VTPDVGIDRLDRLPPQNLEAEQSVLGAILIENGALNKALEVITEADFYRESHRRIFGAVLELFDRGEAIDLVTVAEQLGRNGDLEAVGGNAYIASLASQVPTAANIIYHSKIIREKALLRELLRSSTDIAAKVYEEGDEADDLLDFAERSIFEISDRRMKGMLVSLKDVVKDSFEMIEKLYAKKEAVTGVASGITDMDLMTTGFQDGDLVIIGGRPSMGKTALALNIAEHVTVDNKEPVAVFSLEMALEQLVLRLLCSRAKVNSNNVRQGKVEKSDWNKLTTAAGQLMDAPLFIDDSSNINVLEMRAKARRLKMEHGLSMIIVDYLQLMRGRMNFERREQEISDITRSLKALAKELKVPVVALSQLNRGVELRTDKRPSLSDLRESGAIEQDADIIIFLYRDYVYRIKEATNDDQKRNANDLKNIGELIVAKQRNGPTGIIKVSFLDYCTRFQNLSRDREYKEEEADYSGEPF